MAAVWQRRSQERAEGEGDTPRAALVASQLPVMAHKKWWSECVLGESVSAVHALRKEVRGDGGRARVTSAG